MELGFKCLVSDAGISVCFDSKGQPEMIVIDYVDDSIFMGPNKSKVNEVKAKFMKMWECQDLGENKGVFVNVHYQKSW